MVSPRSTRSPLVEIFNVNQPQPSLKIVRSYTGLSSTTSQATCFFPLALRGGQRLHPRMVLIFFPSKGPRLRSIRARNICSINGPSLNIKFRLICGEPNYVASQPRNAGIEPGVHECEGT